MSFFYPFNEAMGFLFPMARSLAYPSVEFKQMGCSSPPPTSNDLAFYEEGFTFEIVSFFPVGPLTVLLLTVWNSGFSEGLLLF